MHGPCRPEPAEKRARPVRRSLTSPRGHGRPPCGNESPGASRALLCLPSGVCDPRREYPLTVERMEGTEPLAETESSAQTTTIEANPADAAVADADVTSQAEQSASPSSLDRTDDVVATSDQADSNGSSAAADDAAPAQAAMAAAEVESGASRDGIDRRGAGPGRFGRLNDDAPSAEAVTMTLPPPRPPLPKPAMRLPPPRRRPRVRRRQPPKRRPRPPLLTQARTQLRPRPPARMPPPRPSLQRTTLPTPPARRTTKTN